MNINPLQQYFRRPVIHMRLPSQGTMYGPGIIDFPENNELPVYPMTAIDEITVKTPDALFNGSAMADLIKSCVPAIKDPWKINSVDLDAVLIAIKTATNGPTMELETTCPSCTESAKFDINLMGLLTQIKKPEYDNEMSINELNIKFRPLTYREINEAGLVQFEMQREFLMIENEKDEELKISKSNDILKKITTSTMKILSTSIECIKTPNVEVDSKEFIIDFLMNCDKNTFVSIRDHQALLKSQSEIQPFDVTCIHCKYQYKQPFTLNTSDFFV